MSSSTKSRQQKRGAPLWGWTKTLFGQRGVFGSWPAARSLAASTRFTATTVPALKRRSELEFTTYSHSPPGSTAIPAGKKMRSAGGEIPLSPKPQPAPAQARRTPSRTLGLDVVNVFKTLRLEDGLGRGQAGNGQA